MSKRLNNQDRSILSYRPNIFFVEPDQEQIKIRSREEPIQLEEIQEQRDKVKKLAQAVSTLATAVQARVDIKSKDMIIKLDPIADATIVASVKRMYGHENIDPYQITYEQYKKCKDRLYESGIKLGQKVIIDPEDIKKQKDRISDVSNDRPPRVDFSGANTPEAKTGGLRPELSEKNRIIEPLDLEKFQSYIVRAFINEVWRKFIKGAMPDFVRDLLEDEIAEIPDDGITGEDMLSLGIPIFGLSPEGGDDSSEDSSE